MSSSIGKKMVKRSIQAARKTVKSSPMLSRNTQRLLRAVAPNLAPTPKPDFDIHAHYPTISSHLKEMELAKTLKNRPLISVILPTYNTPLNYLSECIDSVVLQSYDNWELCIADDASSDSKVTEYLQNLANNNPKVKLALRKSNGHISEASNSAIAIAKGEYCALLDHDDILWPNSLYEIVKRINEQPDADLIYTDEDKIGEDVNIHYYPFFKPDWSPEFLESCNYITHFSVIKTTRIKEIGGFRKGYEGAQDWDLFIRLSSVCKNISHIPKLLYSWRVHINSTSMSTESKPYVYEAQNKLLKDYGIATGIESFVDTGIIKEHRYVGFLPKKNSTSIVVVVDVIPAQGLVSWIKELRATNDTPVSLVSRPSLISSNEITELSKELPSIKVYSENNSLNSGINNAVKMSKQNNVLIVSTLLKDLSSGWDQTMSGELEKSGVGAVGGLLLKDKNTIWNAGYTINSKLEDLDLFMCQPITGGTGVQPLYRDSKRNVIGSSSLLMGINKKAFAEAGGFKPELGDYADISLGVTMKGLGFRTIFTPYVKSTIPNSPRAKQPLHKVKFLESLTYDQLLDPYYNPNFKSKPRNLFI
jgi:O-antigen biosynthesis protein